MVYQAEAVSEVIAEEKREIENYIPKMKPGDVEIPNRVFVKGFPREATADDLFTFFEEYGQVLECRIVADRYGCSKGFGFVTFDSQNIAEKVKEMERINYSEDVELVIGPARIRKKKYYLLPATPQYMPAPPQQMYTADGNVVWTTAVPQSQSMSLQPSTQMYQTPVPMQMQPMMQATQQAYHTQPYIFVNDSPQMKQHQPCVTYTTTPPSMNYVEKVPMQQTMQAAICPDEAQQVPNMSPVPLSNNTYHQVDHLPQPINVSQETIVYSHVVPMTTHKRVS